MVLESSQLTWEWESSLPAGYGQKETDAALTGIWTDPAVAAWNARTVEVLAREWCR